MTGAVQRIGCSGHTHFVIIDGRYARWRCKDRNCDCAAKAHATGQWAFHVHDLQTGEQWTEWEPASMRAA